MNLPQAFIERTRQLLGDAAYTQFEEALQTETPVSIRPNRMKCSQPVEGEPIPWASSGSYLNNRPTFTFDPLFHAGCYYVQEASSMFVEKVLQEYVKEPVVMLDLCAAPGGKSTLCRSVLPEGSLLVANEVMRNRSQVLAENLIKWGHPEVVVTNNDPADFTELTHLFDVILTDVPCSGEGMFRKDQVAVDEWSLENVDICWKRQRRILADIWPALKPGGILIYSTCTFNRTEDEEVVARAMEAFGDELEAVEDIAVGDDWGVVTGREGVFQTFRFFPHRLTGEGMFMAVARKAGLATSRRRAPKARRKAMEAVDKRTAQELSRWVKEPEQMRFFAAGDTLYGCRAEHYDEVEALAGTLAVIYSGVAMGQVFKGKLKPDGALALYAGINTQAVECCEVDEDTALKFLRKQDVDATQFAEGVNLVLRCGRPLGFVKRVGARVNNMYPNSLRILK